VVYTVVARPFRRGQPGRDAPNAMITGLATLTVAAFTPSVLLQGIRMGEATASNLVELGRVDRQGGHRRGRVWPRGKSGPRLHSPDQQLRRPAAPRVIGQVNEVPKYEDQCGGPRVRRRHPWLRPARVGAPSPRERGDGMPYPAGPTCAADDSSPGSPMPSRRLLRLHSLSTWSQLLPPTETLACRQGWRDPPRLGQRRPSNRERSLPDEALESSARCSRPTFVTPQQDYPIVRRRGFNFAIRRGSTTKGEVMLEELDRLSAHTKQGKVDEIGLIHL
jgi:hypothetical protein